MNSAPAEKLARVARKQTVRLTHYGRKTGQPHDVTIWFATDGKHIYLSTANVDRHWVRNVQKTPQVKLSIAGELFDGQARFLTDPAERNRFLNLLSSIGSNVTVILSTHIVEDVRELCPRMAIISNGELLLEGAPTEALDSLAGKIWSKVVATDDELRALEATFHVISTHLIGGLHEVRVFADSSPGDGFRPVESGLEDVYFLNLANHAKN